MRAYAQSASDWGDVTRANLLLDGCIGPFKFPFPDCPSGYPWTTLLAMSLVCTSPPVVPALILQESCSHIMGRLGAPIGNWVIGVWISTD